MTKVCFETEAKAQFRENPKDVTLESRDVVALDRTTRTRVQTINVEDSKTQQQFAAQCDVNNIIAKYKKTGELPLARKQGVFADVASITDYHDSLNRVLDANAAFMRLPADLRTRFGNDPQQLLSFLQDPKNYDEGVKLGLYEPQPEPTETTKLNQSITKLTDTLTDQKKAPEATKTKKQTSE